MQRGRRRTGRDAEIIAIDAGEGNWVLQRRKTTSQEARVAEKMVVPFIHLSTHLLIHPTNTHGASASSPVLSCVLTIKHQTKRRLCPTYPLLLTF